MQTGSVKKKKNVSGCRLDSQTKRIDPKFPKEVLF